ncbi:glycosyltransferase family 39 protein [Crossiella cryophila]|uniref:4-amino-4-deoxy-L-arabinose transferase-like glycosyltransferase n=1 Tax=Crossiella cryophila TaxID=43355 RepID=A0A7W7CIS2_9PSEU|nr:glycosyltransferase family 39 protein [Crossiella cryophila]MBB4681971.1 4-amino-4-deoxy-L-arabinose transferase-like glycosyltransferase [Crossiella cryophila]
MSASTVVPEPATARWSRPALAAVLGLAAVLYTWGLSANGYANTYYSAAVLSATKSWSAFFYGSLDAGNFITVDKPPLALWVQALSARVFGFSGWSILLPQALAGIAAVAIVHHVTKRSFGPTAGILAALALTLTPVTVAVTRHNNPDTLLVLLLTLAAWALSNALRSGRLLPLLASALAIGLAFNTKMLQAYLLVPAAAAAYLIGVTGPWWRKLLRLALAGVVLLGVSLSWLLAVDAIAPADRPYIGSSTDNTVSELLFGYNGLGRLFGQNRVGSPGLTVGGGGAGNASGWDRLLTGEVGGQIAWLFPLALAGLLAAFVLRRHRAELVLWGGWLLTTVVVFSTAAGIWHTYYTVALAPPLAVVLGLGGTALWRLHQTRSHWAWLLPVSLALTGFWAATLLGRTPAYLPWLPITVVLLALAAAITLAIPLLGKRLTRRTTALALTAGLVAALAGPAAYAITPLTTTTSVTFPIAQPATTATARPGGFGEADGPDTAALNHIQAEYRNQRWALAVVGALVAAPVILDTGLPVMAIGGFNGNDPAPTATQLQNYVHSGQLRFVWTSGESTVRQFGGTTGTGATVVNQALSWVTANCALVPGTGQLYDCYTATRTS